MLSLLRRLDIDSQVNQLQSPSRAESNRSRRFLSFSELGHLVNLVETKEISEILKQTIKIDEEKGSDKRKSKILVDFPEGAPEFLEISDSAIKNGLLRYNEIVIDEYVLRIE